MAGLRHMYTGNYKDLGISGFYWSSTPNGGNGEDIRIGSNTEGFKLTAHNR